MQPERHGRPQHLTVVGDDVDGFAEQVYDAYLRLAPGWSVELVFCTMVWLGLTWGTSAAVQHLGWPAWWYAPSGISAFCAVTCLWDLAAAVMRVRRHNKHVDASEVPSA